MDVMLPADVCLTHKLNDEVTRPLFKLFAWICSLESVLKL